MVFMKFIENGEFTGERALFAAKQLNIKNSRFFDGESPLKESRDISLSGCTFEWKYPLWYSACVQVSECYLSYTARSGIWYTNDIDITDTAIDAPKTFRRCEGITLKNVDILNAQETLWNCNGVSMTNVKARGDYFGMGSSDIQATGLRLSGNYAFDGGSDIVIRDSVLYSKDAFWNCRNVTVENSVIVGEYLGWNSENVKFVNCDIESNQGICYMDGVVLENCRFTKTDLAFEYCTEIDADIRSHIDSVKNPISGRIVADSIGEIIHDPNFVDTANTEITVRDKND